MDKVLHSLDKPNLEIDRRWIEQAERRLAAHRSGQFDGIPAEDVLCDL